MKTEELNLPDYSVLMSVYKNDDVRYIDQAIQSMVDQTYSFHDLVVVQDGPVSDEIRSCLDQWKLRLGSRFIVLQLPNNLGLGGALQEGISRCGCNVIARMDSDDISRPNRCEKLISFLVQKNLDIVGGSIEEFDKVPGDLGLIRAAPLKQSDIEHRATSRNPFNHVSVVFKRSAVLDAGGYQPFPWMEDYWLWIRMLKNGCRCGNLPDIVVDVRTGEGMYSRRSNVAYLKSQVHFFNELKRIGFISTPKYLMTIAARVGVTLLPDVLVKEFYRLFLRTH